MNASTAAAPDQAIRKPPHTLGGMMRYWGPGLVLTASVVGTGEVIGVPALGAQAGYSLLWLVLVSCVVKLPLQIMIGRQAIQTGQTTLQIMNELPGPRFRVSWFIWAYLATLVVVNLQQGAMIGGCAQVLSLVMPSVDMRVWTAVITASAIVLLVVGRYRMLEKLSAFKVVLFTATTIVCVGFLQGTPHRIDPRELLQGLIPNLRSADVALAMGVFAITGIGTTEIVTYPYWCLDKGYARAAGARDGSEAWYQRARGWIRVMHMDAALSMVVYTVITIAFYALGASVLHGLGQQPEGMSTVSTLSRMYTETLGLWAFLVFLIGAFFALYMTLIVSIAANTTLFLDSLALMGVRSLDDPATRERWRRGFMTGLPILQLTLFLFLQTPVAMVKVGALAQSLMLPIVAFGILWVRYRKLDPRLAPARIVDVILWLGCFAIGAVALFGMITKIMGGSR